MWQKLRTLPSSLNICVFQVQQHRSSSRLRKRARVQAKAQRRLPRKVDLTWQAFQQMLWVMLIAMPFLLKVDWSRHQAPQVNFLKGCKIGRIANWWWCRKSVYILILIPGSKPPHMWSEEETATLWSYVEKFQLQLYHGKDNMTRPQVIAKITALISACACHPFCSILVLYTCRDLYLSSTLHCRHTSGSQCAT